VAAYTQRDVAVAVRPGEHACCRFSHAQDRARLAGAFVLDGLRRGHRVLYLTEDGAADDLLSTLVSSEAVAQRAVTGGQVVLRSVHEVLVGDDGYDVERLLHLLHAECDRALADGCSGLSATWDMGWALAMTARLAEYERRVADAIGSRAIALLCRYDHQRFGASTLADVAAEHMVDASPELAAVGRDGSLSAARVTADRTLRLAGELDFEGADALAEILDAHFHGALRFDLADLRYVDVSGMRALRGRKGQPVQIIAASPPVRRLLALLGWDTDQGVATAGPGG
jgi:anti-anti-sigma regulatory factor